MTKKEMIKELVDKYGYEESDIKAFTNAKLKGLILQEENDAKELEEKMSQPKVTAPVEDKKVNMEDIVTVMSVVNGTFAYRSNQTGFTLRFTEFGQTDEITVAELVRMRNNHPQMLRYPSIVILDNEKVVHYLGLTEFYKNILSADQIESTLNLSLDSFSEVLEKAPKGIKLAILDLIKIKFEEGNFNDYQKMKYLTNKFNIHFDIYE